MRPDEPRAPLRHELDHAIPTVIHHPEDDMPLLERWLHRAMANPTRFWGLLSASIAVLIGLTVLANAFSTGRAVSDTAWAKLETAKTAAERVEIANEFPNTQAQQWALLQAATEYFNQGFNDLPENRDAALPTLKKALDLFEKVAAEAPADSPQARAAALGVGRTLEARNELEKAIKQYEKVAQTKAWAGTDEARQAAELARRLATPEAKAFYKELYAYKPAEATLPPGDVGNFNLPLPAGHPPVGGTSPVPPPADAKGANAEPNPLAVPPPPPTPAAKKEGESKSLEIELTKPSEAPRTETPKADAPGLPADVFTPGGEKSPSPSAPK
jgi:tetratricopeptide (TPR) repeat protein